MRIVRYLLLFSVLLLHSCEKANEIYSPDEYLFEEDGENFRSYDNGPVYLEATSWGCMAYIHPDWVHNDYVFYVSEMEDAEGGIEIPVTSKSMFVSGLKANTQYYYCLYSKTTKSKTNIQSVLVPDISTLSLSLEEDDEYFKCIIGEEINEELIIEKGFKVYSNDKWESFIITDGAFQLAKSEIKAINVSRIYAYLLTEGGYFKSWETYWDNHDSLEEPQFESFSEVKENGADYILCKIYNVQKDAECLFKIRDAQYTERYLSPTSMKWLGENYVEVKLKKDFFKSIQVVVRKYDNGVWYYEHTSDEYEITEYSIYTTDDFLNFVINLRNTWLDVPKTVTLYTDVVIPAKSRMRIDIVENLTLNGNGHKITGFSSFPFFHTIYGFIKNLQIGSKDETYVVKKGTDSEKTNASSYPSYFLYGFEFESNFIDCSLKATVEVWDNKYFTLFPGYSSEKTVSGLEIDVDMIYKTTEP